MAKDKNKEMPQNKIKEGTDASANKESKDTDRESYPKLKKQDKQYKEQWEEFIDEHPNKKDNG